MGYNTRHKINVQGDGPVLERFKNDLDVEKDMVYGRGLDWLAEVKINDKYFAGESEPCKWYDSDEDMQRVSKDYPNLLFTLDGEGEESGDIWRAYYRNGVGQKVHARIVFDEPDLNVLPFIDEVELERLAALQAELEAQKTELENKANEVQQELDRLRSK